MGLPRSAVSVPRRPGPGRVPASAACPGEGAFPPRRPAPQGRTCRGGRKGGGGGALRALRGFAALPGEAAPCNEAPPRPGRAGAAPSPQPSRLNPPRSPERTSDPAGAPGAPMGVPWQPQLLAHLAGVVLAAGEGLGGRGGRLRAPPASRGESAAPIIPCLP